MEIKSITEMLKECNNDECKLDDLFALPGLRSEDYSKEEQEIVATVNEYNDRLVPGSGRANTVAGELIRALCRIYYRWVNDGDVVIPVLGGGCSEYVNPSYCYIYAVLHDYAICTRDESCNETAIERFIDGEFERFTVGIVENDFKNRDRENYTWNINYLAKLVLVCINEFDLEKVENKYDSRDFDDGKVGYLGYYNVRGSTYSMNSDKEKFNRIFDDNDTAEINFDALNECIGLKLNLQFLNDYRFVGEYSYNDCNGDIHFEGCMECITNDWTGGTKKSYEQVEVILDRYNAYSDKELIKYFESLMEFINEHEDGAFEVHYDHPYHTTLDNKLTEDELKLYRSKYDHSEDWIDFKTVELTQYILIKFDELVFVLDKYKEAEIIAAREK